MKNYVLPGVILIAIILVGFTVFSGKRTEDTDNVKPNTGLVVKERPVGEINKDAPEINVVTIDVIGTNFEFDVKEISVKKSDKVVINFVNNQGFHDWVIDEFSAATSQINEGNSATIEFAANQVGEFEYYCSVGNHRAQGMVGKLIVTE